MNAHDELDLGAVLRGHAGEADRGPGLALGDVQKKAGQIRRRRAAAAGAGVAAALAIIVPAALFGGGVIGGDAGDEEPRVTKNSETARPGVIDLTRLQQGEAPQRAWLAGGDIQETGGGEDLAGGGATELARLGDNWLVGDASSTEVVLVAPGGEQLGSWPALSGLVLNDAGTAAAWITDTGIPLVLSEGSTQPAQLTELPAGARAVALVGDECGNPETDPGARGCSVFANVTGDDGTTEFTVVSSHGLVDTASREIVHGGDVFSDSDGERLVGHTSIEDAGSCSALTGPQADSPVWTTCAHSLDAFSPDGTKLLAGPAYRDGFGDKEIAILDAADGTVLANPQVAAAAFVTTTVWEDDSHVLATVFQDGQWAIVRIGVDGSVELATAPAAGTEDGGLFLETR